MARPKKSANEGVFNLLAKGAKFSSAVKEFMADRAAKLRSDPAVAFEALPSNKTKLLPLKDFGFQYLLNSRGLFAGRILDIIGADGVGKSSLVFTMFGWFMQHNVPCLHVETEGKPPAKERILRCLHTNREIAKSMFDVVTWVQAFTIVNAIDQLEEWVLNIRDPRAGDAYVPLHVPCVCVLDSFSKLLAPAEAVNRDYYASKAGENAQEEDEKSKNQKGKPKKAAPKTQELDGGSNLQHAKLAHKWMRRLAGLLTKHNCLLIVIRHQNDKIDMGAMGGGGSFIPVEVIDSFNRTSIGGKAFNQSAAYQLILSSDKKEYAQVRGERKCVAKHTKIKVSKNSYGPGDRVLRYRVIQEARFDTETEHEAAIDFSIGLADVLRQTGLVNVRVKSENSVAVKELNLEDATPRQVSEALHQQPELVEDLGRRLEFVGYGSVPAEPPPLAEQFLPSGEDTTGDSP